MCRAIGIDEETLADLSRHSESERFTPLEQHCSGDLAVWLDLLSRTYYYRGQQRYGATKSGAYVCRNEAKGAGMRAAPGTQ